jgi:hypothetical protein
MHNHNAAQPMMVVEIEMRDASRLHGADAG